MAAMIVLGQIKARMAGVMILKGHRGVSCSVINMRDYVFPSAFEGFGLALTEAMSAGLPVVAYNLDSRIT